MEGNDKETPEMALNDCKKDHYLFFPKGKDQLQYINKTLLRRIFDGQTPFTDEEQELINKFRYQVHTEFKSNQKQIDDFSRQPDSWVLRFLYANDENIGKTIKSLKANIIYRDELLARNRILTPEMQRILNTGVIYSLGRDTNLRPIFQFNLSKFKFKDYSPKDFKEALGFYLDYVLDNMMQPGQIEQWVTIMDFTGFGMFSQPLDAIRELFGWLSLQSGMRTRIYQNYLLHTPNSFKLIYKVVKYFLDKRTQDGINILKSGHYDQIWTHINKDQVEKKFGGNVETLVKDFWPPKSPNDNFYVPKDTSDLAEDEISKFVTNEEYLEMFETGKLDKYKVCEELVEKSVDLNDQENELEFKRMSSDLQHVFNEMVGVAVDIDLEDIEKKTTSQIQSNPTFNEDDEKDDNEHDLIKKFEDSFSHTEEEPCFKDKKYSLVVKSGCDEMNFHNSGYLRKSQGDLEDYIDCAADI